MNWRYNRASMKMKGWHAWRYVLRPPNISLRGSCRILYVYLYIYYIYIYKSTCVCVWERGTHGARTKSMDLNRLLFFKNGSSILSLFFNQDIQRPMCPDFIIREENIPIFFWWPEKFSDRENLDFFVSIKIFAINKKLYLVIIYWNSLIWLKFHWFFGTFISTEKYCMWKIKHKFQ